MKYFLFISFLFIQVLESYEIISINTTLNSQVCNQNVFWARYGKYKVTGGCNQRLQKPIKKVLQSTAVSFRSGECKGYGQITERGLMIKFTEPLFSIASIKACVRTIAPLQLKFEGLVIQ